MSEKRGKLNKKTSQFSFSDQISNRLQRWIQRTTNKRNSDMEQNFKFGFESNAVKDDNMNIKTELSPRTSFSESAQNTRTMEELEKALKDLINNCVTSTMVISNNEANTSLARKGPLKKNFDLDNNNMVDVCGNQAETNTGNQWTYIGCQSERGQHLKTENKTVSLSEVCNNNENYVLDNKRSETLPQCGDEQTRSSPKYSSRIGLNGSHSPKDGWKEKGAGSPQISVTEQGNGKTNQQDEEQLNHSSKHVETDEVNTSASNANNGLGTGNSIKSQQLRGGRAGHIVMDGDKTEAAGEKRSDGSEKERPPLRRIQSEGDAIAKSLSFKDSDVSEFAETCLRHAQKKRWSETRSVDIKSEPLCNLDITFDEAVKEEAASQSPKRVEPKKETSSPVRNERRNTFEFESLFPATTTADSKLDSTITAQKDLPPMRPTSLSFPLEKQKKKRITKESIFKSKSTSKSANNSPCSPKRQPSVSPKFKKFPTQPVFYVPKASEVSPPDIADVRQSGSLSDSLKHAHSEYLI